MFRHIIFAGCIVSLGASSALGAAPSKSAFPTSIKEQPSFQLRSGMSATDVRKLVPPPAAFAWNTQEYGEIPEDLTEETLSCYSPVGYMFQTYGFEPLAEWKVADVYVKKPLPRTFSCANETELAHLRVQDWRASIRYEDKHVSPVYRRIPLRTTGIKDQKLFVQASIPTSKWNAFNAVTGNRFTMDWMSLYSSAKRNNHLAEYYTLSRSLFQFDAEFCDISILDYTTQNLTSYTGVTSAERSCDAVTNAAYKDRTSLPKDFSVIQQVYDPEMNIHQVTPKNTFKTFVDSKPIDTLLKTALKRFEVEPSRMPYDFIARACSGTENPDAALPLLTEIFSRISADVECSEYPAQKQIITATEKFIQPVIYYAQSGQTASSAQHCFFPENYLVDVSEKVRVDPSMKEKVQCVEVADVPEALQAIDTNLRAKVNKTYTMRPTIFLPINQVQLELINRPEVLFLGRSRVGSASFLNTTL